MAADEAAARRKRVAAFMIRTALGAAIVGFLLWRYDLRTVAGVLKRETPGWFAATVLLYVAGQVMSAWRWQLLASLAGILGSFREFVAYYFIGMFTNLFIPGLVGGDAARAIYLGRRRGPMGSAFASVLADRGTGLIALFWLAAAATPAMAGRLPRPILILIPIAGLAALAGLLAAPLIERLLFRIPGRPGEWARLMSPYLLRPVALLPAIGLSIILQISLVMGQYFLSRGLGLTIPMTVFLLVMPVANAVASIPVTLNGLGLREATYLLMLGAAGTAHADAVALGLLWFAATMLGGLTGIIAVVATPVSPAVTTAAEGPR